MFRSLMQRRSEKKNALLIYQGLVQQARTQEFYTKLGVEDTLEGRFDMILLHVWLVDHALEKAGPEFVRLRRYIQETLVSDMDRSFRELGVGDMSVGKEMKKVGAALLGRKAAYQNALEQDTDNSLMVEAVAKNIFRDKAGSGAAVVADYITRTLAESGDAKATDPATVSLRFANLI
jgi:cytochrome b pre-mRNA-processing protein 3